MNFIKSVFHFIGKVLSFINNHFKALLFLLIIYLIFGNALSKGEFEKPNLARIDIHGAIMEPSQTLEDIYQAKKDSNIQGVLLHVNSPGGALAPSVELSYAIKELALTKPVIAYAAGAMTSGSYYASIWSKKIFANPGAFIGSIGVVFNSFNIKPLADKIGIKEQSIQAGKYKQAGTFMREWTADEKQSLETLIDNAYELFVSDVAKARGLDISKTTEFADAKVFLASKAKQAGLVDTIGTLEDAKNYLIEQSGVSNPVWKKKDEFDMVLEKLANESAKTFIRISHGLHAY